MYYIYISLYIYIYMSHYVYITRYLNVEVEGFWDEGFRAKGRAEAL